MSGMTCSKIASGVILSEAPKTFTMATTIITFLAAMMRLLPSPENIPERRGPLALVLQEEYIDKPEPGAVSV